MNIVFISSLYQSIFYVRTNDLDHYNIIHNIQMISCMSEMSFIISDVIMSCVCVCVIQVDVC